jgi:hypothetical protein
MSPRHDSRRTRLSRAGTGSGLDVAITVSELLSDALRYGPAPATEVESYPALRLAYWDRWSCAVCGVTDESDQAPVAVEAEGLAESGRGLQVVPALSESWGWNPRADGGKVVWALFRL